MKKHILLAFFPHCFENRRHFSDETRAYTELFSMFEYLLQAFSVLHIQLQLVGTFSPSVQLTQHSSLSADTGRWAAAVRVSPVFVRDAMQRNVSSVGTDYTVIEIPAWNPVSV